MKGKQVLVGLSGGVDSAVAAYLLQEQGFSVSGAYIKTWKEEAQAEDLFAHCPWQDDIDSARAVASHLGIPFEVVNLIEDYQKHVVGYLVEGYRKGITPNPDVLCNKTMKFGVFLDYAKKMDFDWVATGHYCQKKTLPDGTVALLEGADSNKDQSYFLALVSQAQLKDSLFPIGALHKPEVRALAKEIGLPNAHRKDSQGICFLGKIPINQFLAQYIEDTPGPIVNQKGIQVGTHHGLHRFTLGQRKGLGVPSNTDFKNYIVVAKDYATNTLFVDFDEGFATPGLYTAHVTVSNLHFTGNPLMSEQVLLAKPRYRDPSVKITYCPIFDKTGQLSHAEVAFETPQRALAPGQVLAFYDGKRLLGGGFYL